MYLVGADPPPDVAEEQVLLVVGGLVLEPAPDGVVVVRPRVGDTVPCDVMRRVRVLCDVAGETEGQDLHPREPEVGHHLVDIGGDVAEVFGDDREARPAPHKQGEEIPAGGIDPAPVLCGLIPGRHLPVLHEPPEMVEAQPVDEGEGAFDPALPPREPLLPVRVPVVDRVPPELPGSAERIRGHARDGGRFLLLVEFEETRVRPDVDAVVGEVDGDVPDDLEVACTAVDFQRLPLAVEDILEKLLPEDPVGKFRAVFFERLLASVPDPGRPIAPDLPGEPLLESDEDGVIVEPRRAAGRKILVTKIALMSLEPLERPIEEAVLVVENHTIVDPVYGKFRRVCDVLRGEEAVRDHLLGADEPGVPRERRGALVG